MRRLYDCIKQSEDSDTKFCYSPFSLDDYLSYSGDRHAVSGLPAPWDTSYLSLETTHRGIKVKEIAYLSGSAIRKLSTRLRIARSEEFFFDSIRLSEESEILTPEQAEQLIQYLDRKPLPHLSHSDAAHLAVIVQTHIQVDAQRRALDNNGMRFLLSLKSFAISHRTQSTSVTRAPSPSLPQNTKGTETGQRLPQMRWRDVLWAFHSESQEILLSACDEVCGKPVLWEDAKQFCLPLWIRSNESLVRIFAARRSVNVC